MRVRFSEKPYDFDPIRDMPVYRLLAVPCLGDRFGTVASVMIPHVLPPKSATAQRGPSAVAARYSRK